MNASKWLAGGAIAASVILVSGCGSSTKSAANSQQVVVPPVQQTTEAAAPTEAVPVSTAADSGSSASDATTWTMPDMRGKDLQSAQDGIQALTGDAVFFTSSHDASGQGRHQFLDRDWQVCTQNVAPGAKFDANANIDFGVVRIDTESCP